MPSGDVPGVEEARALYKAVGLDPTKTRPSNEALLRRVLKGEALYTVNTLVDALNLSSVREQMPFGLYDLDRVEPPVELRRGRPGESYEGIRKAAVNVDGRPVLSDARGAFGNPTSDSARTMITLDTRRTLVIAYAPATATGVARAGRAGAHRRHPGAVQRRDRRRPARPVTAPIPPRASPSASPTTPPTGRPIRRR